MLTKNKKLNLVSLLLRIGLASVFLYAAVSSLKHPIIWAAYLPHFLTSSISSSLLIKIFAVYEILLSIWLLLGKYVEYAALLSAATFAGIVITNPSQLFTTFRDIGLFFKRSVIIRSQEELQTLINLDPFKGVEDNHNKESYLLITFFKVDPAIKFRLPFSPDNKPYTILGKLDRAIYGSINLSEEKTPNYMAWLEKQFGKEITSRTPNTVRLILKRMTKN